MRADLRTRLRFWLRRQWQVLLISGGLAIFVFYTVRANISYSETRNVPVEVEREPGLALMAVRPASVRITFRGALSELRQMSRQDVQVLVKPPRDGLSGGTARMRLTRRQVRGAAGSRVVSIEPGDVLLTFDHEGEREFAIASPQIEGRPLRGRVEIDYSPRVARVRGARMQLDNLHDSGVQLQPEPINVDGRVQSFTRRVAIQPPADAWMPEIVPAEIVVKVDIVPDNAVRLIEAVPVRIALPPGEGEGTPSPAACEPAVVGVRLVGRAEVLRDVPPEALRVYADLADTAGGAVTGAVPLRVLLSGDFQVDGLAAEPPVVRLLPAAQTHTPPADTLTE